MIRFVFKSQEVGAYNSAFAAAASAVRENPNQYKGAYLLPVGKIGVSLKIADDPVTATELRQTTENILRDIGVLK